MPHYKLPPIFKISLLDGTTATTDRKMALSSLMPTQTSSNMSLASCDGLHNFLYSGPRQTDSTTCSTTSSKQKQTTSFFTTCATGSKGNVTSRLSRWSSKSKPYLNTNLVHVGTKVHTTETLSSRSFLVPTREKSDFEIRAPSIATII